MLFKKCAAKRRAILVWFCSREFERTIEFGFQIQDCRRKNSKWCQLAYPDRIRENYSPPSRRRARRSGSVNQDAEKCSPGSNRYARTPAPVNRRAWRDRLSESSTHSPVQLSYLGSFHCHSCMNPRSVDRCSSVRRSVPQRLTIRLSSRCSDLNSRSSAASGSSRPNCFCRSASGRRPPFRTRSCRFVRPAPNRSHWSSRCIVQQVFAFPYRREADCQLDGPWVRRRENDSVKSFNLEQFS